MPPFIKKISAPIKAAAKPIQNLKRTLSDKINAISMARKAAHIFRKRLPFTNLNIPPYSEVTLYTESYPEGINANVRPQGMKVAPDLMGANQKLFNGSVPGREFYYKHEKNCGCSTATSEEEVHVKDTRQPCKMTKTVRQDEIGVEAEEVTSKQRLRRNSMISQEEFHDLRGG